MNSEDINVKELDIFDDSVENITEKQKDALLEREKALALIHQVPTVPCECFFCQNWIDNSELFYIIGFQNDKIICLRCAEPIFEREDNANETD